MATLPVLISEYLSEIRNLGRDPNLNHEFYNLNTLRQRQCGRKFANNIFKLAHTLAPKLKNLDYQL